MKIAIGADHRGSEAAQQLAQILKTDGHEVLNTSICDSKSCDYPDMAYPTSKAVADHVADFGILVCGTGIGMSIAANKVKGVRAALVHDELGAELSRRHNDANVLCLSSEMLAQRNIDRVVKMWLSTEFAGGRHARRIEKVTAIENGLDPSTVGDSQAVSG